MKYVVLKATTNSEWDICEFALVQITDEVIDLYKRVSEREAPLRQEFPELASLSIYGVSVVFYSDLEELPKSVIDSIGSVVDLSDDVVEGLSKPEQKVVGYCSVFDNMGITFSGYGKHSGDEFFTTDYLEIQKL